MCVSTQSLRPCGGAFAAFAAFSSPPPSLSSSCFLFFFFLSAFVVEESGGRCSVAAERAAAALARVCRAEGEENETMAEHCGRGCRTRRTRTRRKK